MLIVFLLSYPSLTGPSGAFTVLSARSLPMANLSFFTGIQYTREHYLQRYTEANNPYGVDHHFAKGYAGLAYGIIDYLEAYIGGTFYGKYEERKDDYAGYQADLWTVGNENIYGGFKVSIPVLNDTPRIPVSIFIGFHGSGATTILDRRPEDKDLALNGNFYPTNTHKADYEGDFLLDVEIFPLMLHANLGYIRRGIRDTYTEFDTLNSYFNRLDSLNNSNSFLYGAGIELCAGPWTRLLLGVKGNVHLRDIDIKDTLMGMIGIRFTTPVGVTFDLGGEYSLINNIDVVPDWDWRNGEDYFNESGKWKFTFGFTTTNALIERKKKEVLPPPPPPKIKEGTLVVSLRDMETDEPLMGNVIFEDTTIGVYSTDITGKVTIKLKPGTYNFKLVKDGYISKQGTIHIIEDQVINIDQTLKKIYIPIGIFTGTVTDARTKKPIGAKITFLGTDEKPIVSDIETGIFKKELKEGTYNVKIEADGYVPQTIIVVIKDKETTINNISLYEQLKEKQVLVFNDINFETGKAVILPSSYPILDNIAELLKANENVKIEIGGHTDSQGSDSYNLRLSEARANAVRNYLIQKGIDPSRLIARGYGESMPIAPNTTREGRAKNRRVEFKVISQ